MTQRVAFQITQRVRSWMAFPIRRRPRSGPLRQSSSAWLTGCVPDDSNGHAHDDSAVAFPITPPDLHKLVTELRKGICRRRSHYDDEPEPAATVTNEPLLLE